MSTRLSRTLGPVPPSGSKKQACTEPAVSVVGVSRASVTCSAVRYRQRSSASVGSDEPLAVGDPVVVGSVGPEPAPLLDSSPQPASNSAARNTTMTHPVVRIPVLPFPSVPADASQVTTFADLLARRIGDDPGRPLVTFYDLESGERAELSVTTYANWVAKTASLLADEHDLERGATLRVDLPPHWLGPVFLGAAWLLGLAVT